MNPLTPSSSRMAPAKIIKQNVYSPQSLLWQEGDVDTWKQRSTISNLLYSQADNRSPGIHTNHLPLKRVLIYENVLAEYTSFVYNCLNKTNLESTHL